MTSKLHSTFCDTEYLCSFTPASVANSWRSWEIITNLSALPSKHRGAKLWPAFAGRKPSLKCRQKQHPHAVLSHGKSWGKKKGRKSHSWHVLIPYFNTFLAQIQVRRWCEGLRGIICAMRKGCVVPLYLNSLANKPLLKLISLFWDKLQLVQGSVLFGELQSKAALGWGVPKVRLAFSLDRL